MGLIRRRWSYQGTYASKQPPWFLKKCGSNVIKMIPEIGGLFNYGSPWKAGNATSNYSCRHSCRMRIYDLNRFTMNHDLCLSAMK